MISGQFSPSETDNLYQERILEHFEEPYHRGPCPCATHAHEGENTLCGDSIRIELQIDGANTVCNAYFDGDGCCISQAAASMLMEDVEGKPVDALQQFTAEEMLELFGPRLTPNRQKCALLPWRVLQQALAAPISGKSQVDC